MTTAAKQASDKATTAPSDQRQRPLPFRGDTLLGVCEAIGQDLGFNPNWLRIAFAALLMWNPELIVAVYLGLGVIVAITRWLLADRSSPTAEQPGEPSSDLGQEEQERLAA